MFPLAAHHCLAFFSDTCTGQHRPFGRQRAAGRGCRSGQGSSERQEWRQRPWAARTVRVVPSSWSTLLPKHTNGKFSGSEGLACRSGGERTTQSGCSGPVKCPVVHSRWQRELSSSTTASPLLIRAQQQRRRLCLLCQLQAIVSRFTYDST